MGTINLDQAIGFGLRRDHERWRVFTWAVDVQGIGGARNELDDVVVHDCSPLSREFPSSDFCPSSSFQSNFSLQPVAHWRRFRLGMLTMGSPQSGQGFPFGESVISTPLHSRIAAGHKLLVAALSDPGRPANPRNTQNNQQANETDQTAFENAHTQPP